MFGKKKEKKQMFGDVFEKTPQAHGKIIGHYRDYRQLHVRYLCVLAHARLYCNGCVLINSMYNVCMSVTVFRQVKLMSVWIA